MVEDKLNNMQRVRVEALDRAISSCKPPPPGYSEQANALVTRAAVFEKYINNGQTEGGT